MGKASRYGFFSPGSKDSDKEFVRHMGVRLVRELRMVVFCPPFVLLSQVPSVRLLGSTHSAESECLAHITPNSLRKVNKTSEPEDFSSSLFGRRLGIDTIGHWRIIERRKAQQLL